MPRLWLARLQTAQLAFFGSFLMAPLFGAGCMKPGAPPGVPTVEVAVNPVNGAPTAAGGRADAPHPGAESDGRVAGERVEVEWHGSWFPATLLERKGDRWLIHYERFGDEWDETVEHDRIRDTVTPVGEDVTEDDGDP